MPATSSSCNLWETEDTTAAVLKEESMSISAQQKVSAAQLLINNRFSSLSSQMSSCSENSAVFLYRIDMWRPQSVIQMQFTLVNNGQRQRVFPSYYKAQTVTVVTLTRWVLMPFRPFHSPVKSFHSIDDVEAEGANMFTTLRDLLVA